MRVIKPIAYTVLGITALLGSGLAYTAQTAYELPEATPPIAFAEFTPSAPRRPGERSVVVLVFDGFAPSTLRAANTPHLDRIAREGAHTLEMMPVFPSLSMPNHFSLITGCYPERHGVVSNHFLDPERGVFRDRGDADWLETCEPLHVVAERQGVRSAVLGAVAAASKRRGKLATIAEPYVHPPPDARARADRVIALLEAAPEARPGLIIAYVTEPDHTSHVHGPTAKPTLAAAEACDAQVGRIMQAIERLGLRDQVTLVVTTDHGMVAAHTLVSVERLLRRAGADATVLAEGSLAHVYLSDAADKARAMAALSRHDFVDVIDPERAPEHLHLGRSERVGDFVVSARAGYWVADTAHWPWHMRWASFVGDGLIPSERFAGMHGYDPKAVPEVRAIFFAWGAEVPTGARISGLRSVDVHPTLAAWLSIAPGSPVDGRARLDLVARAAADTPAAAVSVEPSAEPEDAAH